MITSATFLIALPALCAGEDPPGRTDTPAGPAAGERMERAAADLRDAWFLIEKGSRVMGYHRIQVARSPDGSLLVQDEMALLPSSGRISLRSEVTTGPNPLDPKRVRCETRQGPGQGSITMKGSIEFGAGELRLVQEVFVDGLGNLLETPRAEKGSLKRPQGPILIQALVPLLLAAAAEGEDGSDFGKVTVAEIPVDVGRLLALKEGRSLEVEAASGGVRKVFIRSGKERSGATIIRCSKPGAIARIEMEDFTERRADPKDVRKAMPDLFAAK